MAINVTLGEVKTQEPKPFPKIMESNNPKGFIVLFFNHDYGTCLTSSGDYVAGERYNQPATNFTDYNEPITIQNV